MAGPPAIQCAATAARFNIQSIPTLLFFRGEREADRMVDVRPKPEIARRLERDTRQAARSISAVTTAVSMRSKRIPGG
jgi:hypothetical protein